VFVDVVALLCSVLVLCFYVYCLGDTVPHTSWATCATWQLCVISIKGAAMISADTLCAFAGYSWFGGQTGSKAVDAISLQWMNKLLDWWVGFDGSIDVVQLTAEEIKGGRMDVQIIASRLAALFITRSCTIHACTYAYTPI